MAWTSTDLVASVKRRAGIPAGQATFSDTDILTICNEEFSSYIVPLVLKEREDYWFSYTDFAITASTSQFRIPSRAVGSKVREVQTIVDGLGTQANIPRLMIATQEPNSVGFRIDGNVIVLKNGTSTDCRDLGTTCRVYYYLRPNQLVAEASVGVVESINTGSKQVTLVSAPAAYTGKTSFDMVRGTPGFETLAADAAGTLSSRTITFSSSLPADLAAGDYIPLPNQTCVPQIPPELHPLLAQKAACRVLESTQMLDKLGASREELTKMENDARAILAPRVDGESPKVINRRSLFRMRW